MKPSDHADKGRFGRILPTAAAGIVFVLGLAASVSAAPEGNLKSMSMELTGGGGFPGPLRVISEDQQTWSTIKAGTELLMEGSVKIEMSTGKIAAFGIYWGQCGGDNCWEMFEGWATPLIYSDFFGGQKAVNKWVIFQFPTSKILVTSPQGIAPSPYGDQIIAACNAALVNGGDIYEGHSFDFTMPVTLAVDTHTGAGLEPAINQSPLPLKDVDYAKTIDVSIPVICEPVPQSPSASANVGATLPPFEVLSATLHGDPSGYDGACPVDLKLFMSARSNIKGPYEARVEAKSGWKSKKYVAQTTEPGADGTWTKHFQDTLIIPIVLPMNQSTGGGAGAAAQGIGQFGTVQPDPDIVFPGSDGTPAASGQVQTGYNPGNLHEDSLRLNVSGGGKTVVSEWWKYSVTCDPNVAPFAGSTPQVLGQPVVVQQAFLATFPEAPSDGSKCGLSVSGLIQTNVKNATVKFRLKNHQGDTTGWQTIQTSHANNIGQFVEYLDFSSSGQGAWVTPGGGWTMPDAGAGSQAGRKTGTLQIVTEQPTLFEGNIASYDFACHDPAPTGLGTAPTVKLNPDLPDSSGDLVGKAAEPDIFWVQQRLLELGYREVGKIDGDFGGRTRRALLAFKADNGLPRTPTIDDGLIEALLAAPPRKSQAGRQTNKEQSAKDPGTAAPRRVVVTPVPGISCEGGAVRNGQCVCRQGFKPAKASGGFRCSPVAIDPPIAPAPLRRAVPTIACEGGVVRNGNCVCPRGASLRAGVCRLATVKRQSPRRIAPQPLRVAPTIRRTP